MSNLAWKHDFLLPFLLVYIISSAILASAFGHVEEVMGVSIPLKHNLKGGKKITNQVLWTPCNVGRDRGGKVTPSPVPHSVQEMDGYNLLLPQTRVFMAPPFGWGVKMVSRETETFLFKSTLKRGMRGAAESQGKEMMRVALSFYFFFFFFSR